MSRTDALRKSDVFRDLSDTELHMVATLCSPVHFQAGETVYRVGARRQRALVITEGSIGVFVEIGGAGRRVDTYSIGEVVAPGSLVGSGPVGLLTLEALDEVRALAIPGARFQEFTEAYPQISVKVMTALVARLHRRALHLYYALAGDRVGMGQPAPVLSLVQSREADAAEGAYGPRAMP